MASSNLHLTYFALLNTDNDVIFFPHLFLKESNVRKYVLKWNRPYFVFLLFLHNHL